MYIGNCVYITKYTFHIHTYLHCHVTLDCVVAPIWIPIFKKTMWWRFCTLVKIMLSYWEYSAHWMLRSLRLSSTIQYICVCVIVFFVYCTISNIHEWIHESLYFSSWPCQQDGWRTVQYRKNVDIWLIGIDRFNPYSKILVECVSICSLYIFRYIQWTYVVYSIDRVCVYLVPNIDISDI